jgi:acyl-coenzyme A synthetase/AMP-(fatty) acid ligase
MSPSGDFEYIGRIDRQIKHIGHRIELEEIEKVALDFQGVTASAVVYCKEKSTLWLFYTGSAQMKDLVLYFREVLPAFMVPRKVVKRQEMPLLPNGKIDYNTLNTYTEKGM